MERDATENMKSGHDVNFSEIDFLGLMDFPRKNPIIIL